MQDIDNTGYDSAVLSEIKQEQMKINQTLAQFQLNFDQEITRFENILRGIEYDQDGNEIQLYRPIMNDRGRSHVMKKVRMWFSKIIAQSNFTKHEINKWCIAYWNTLVAECYSYGELWALDYDEYSSHVLDLVLQLQSIMNSALDAGLRDAIGKVTSSRETSYVNMPQENKKAVI